MYRSAKYRNTLNLIAPFLLGALLLCVNYQIIVWGVRRDFLNFAYFIWVLVGFSILAFYLELIYFMFSVMEITSTEIIFTKPWRRFGLFRKRQSRWVIPHSEWTELHAFHFKSMSALYFRKENEAVFFAVIDGGNGFVKKLKKHFREKLIYMSSNNKFPKRLSEMMIREFPERIMHA
nr:hypothetical protein [uncultured Fluviicola sp.]